MLFLNYCLYYKRSAHFTRLIFLKMIYEYQKRSALAKSFPLPSLLCMRLWFKTLKKSKKINFKWKFLSMLGFLWQKSTPQLSRMIFLSAAFYFIEFHETWSKVLGTAKYSSLVKNWISYQPDFELDMDAGLIFEFTAF